MRQVRIVDCEVVTLASPRDILVELITGRDSGYPSLLTGRVLPPDERLPLIIEEDAPYIPTSRKHP